MKTLKEMFEEWGREQVREQGPSFNLNPKLVAKLIELEERIAKLEERQKSLDETTLI